MNDVCCICEKPLAKVESVEVFRENEKYKERSNYNVALDQVSYDNKNFIWELSIEWHDGSEPIVSTYNDFKKALVEFNRS